MGAKPEDMPGGVVPVSAQWECINLRYLQSACFWPAFGWLVPMVCPNSTSQVRYSQMGFIISHMPGQVG